MQGGMGQLQTLFQSAPLTEARGDSSRTLARASLDLFQSAPLTEARGDISFLDGFGEVLGFNPLPSPKQGETSALRMMIKH